MKSTSTVFIILKAILFALIILTVALSMLWAKTALFFLAYEYGMLKTIASWGFIAFWLAVFLLYPRKLHALIVYIIGFFLVFSLWYSVPPSNDRDWLDDYEYHSSRDDYSAQYITSEYNLNDLEGVDFILSHWSDQVMVAHTMLAFRFKGSRNLVLSVETRREKGEPWDIPRGFFNQYELMFVLGTEEDLIGRRVNVSNQDVFLYPTNLNKQESRELLENAILKINAIYKEPRYYNTLKQNCTSSLFEVSRQPELFEWFNPQLILNGVSDRYARKVGIISGEGSYWEFKYNHYISPIVRGIDSAEEFSSLIRSSQ